MAAGELARIAFSLQTAQHNAPFESRNDQSGQFARVDVRTNLAFPLALFDDRLQTVEQRMKSLPSFASQLRVAVIGLDRSVQKRTSPRNQPVAPLPKIPQVLTQAVHGVRHFIQSFETCIHCKFPSMVEGLYGQFLFAVEVAVDSAFFE